MSNSAIMMVASRQHISQHQCLMCTLQDEASCAAVAAAASCLGCRVMYHVEQFTAGWRNLVLFYLAM
jgi:predicted aconitase